MEPGNGEIELFEIYFQYLSLAILEFTIPIIDTPTLPRVKIILVACFDVEK